VQLEAWSYSTGFPKSTNLSKSLDKLRGVNREKELEIQTYLREKRKSLGLSKAEVDRLVFGGTTRYSWVEGRGGDRSSEIYLPTPEEWMRLKGVLDLDDRYDSYITAAIPSREMRMRADGGKADLISTVEGDWGYQKTGERWDGTRRITSPTSDLAKMWMGYGTALKPSWEVIVCARKGEEGRLCGS
jgi:site-specific DNA-methyltransferase (adenine-specific)